ncbi:MAG: ABC transporter substrate-binding protein [Treponema sp.]|nr:ABC transporter substrate-binding protein [Treponema sp.]
MKLKVKNLIFLFSFLLILCLIPLLILFTGKKTNPEKKVKEQSDKLILGFSQIGSESAWRTRNTQSIFEAAAENNIQIIFDDAQQKQENQLKAIRSFIVYQVDVIAFVPIVEDGWDNVLTEAKEAGIPVILVDRQIKSDKSLYAGFLGEDGLEEGRKAARFLLEKCKDREKDINIFEISGTENSSVVRERAKGFREIIEKDSKFKLIHTENGDFLRSRGKEIGDQLIKESMNNADYKKDGLYFNNKKIDVIYSHNDSMTLGLLDSIDTFGIDTSSTIIISIDGEQKSIDALKKGKINCVVECNPNLGNMLMTLVKKIKAGEEIPAITYNQESIFTEDDDFSLYKPRGY